MQIAATTNRLIGYSSKLGFSDSEIVVSRGGLIQNVVVSHLTQTLFSQEAFLKLTNALIHLAEQAYSLRDLDALEEVGKVLMNVPMEGARQVGSYYYALAINRKGQRNEAETLLEKVADNAPITYRARAIQTLGANHHDRGSFDDALRFQLEALRVASEKNAHGLLTKLMAHIEISILKSLDGDHRGALGILENVSPLVNIVAKEKPFYFYSFHNDLAVELSELGRLDEATAALEVALASPYAAAYPNWAETRQELDAKRTSATPSVVSVNRTPNPQPSPQVETQRKPASSRLPRCNWSPANQDTFQIALVLIPAATNTLNAISILDQLIICIGPRAPPEPS